MKQTQTMTALTKTLLSKALLATACLPACLNGQQELVGDLTPGPADTLAVRYAALGSRTIVQAIGPSTASASFWLTDGSPSSLTNIPGLSRQARRMLPLGDRMLLVSDPPAGSQAIELVSVDIATTVATTIATFPLSAFEWGDTLGELAILSIDDGVHGREPWVTDGTAAGTRLLQDLVPGPAGSQSILGYQRIGDLMYLIATNGTGAATIWSTDGSTAVLVGTASTGVFYGLTSSARKLYWVTSELGFARLFVFDPNTGQTTELASSTTSWGVTNESLVPFAGGVLFDFDVDGSNNREPFYSDGTVAGTGPILELHPAGASFPVFSGVSTSQGALFRGRNGVDSGIYVTDGTAAGTALVKAKDATYSFLLPLGSLDAERALISAYSASLQRLDLLVTDGSPQGTSVLAYNVGGTFPLHLHNGRVYFMRDDPIVGAEPWVLSVAPTAVAVGQGCGTGTRLPNLTATAPRFGSTMTFFGEQAPVGVSSALFLSAVPTQVNNLGGRCMLELDSGSLSALHAFVSTSEEWQYSVTLPSVPALQGLTIATQAWFSQPSHAGGLESSNAVHLALGL